MRTLAACVLALFVSAPVAATPFTWVISGTFTTITNSVAGPFAGLFQVGQPFSLALTMESAAPEVFPYTSNPFCGVYAPITAMTFTSGSVALSKASPSQDYFVRPTGTNNCEISPDGLGRIRASFYQFLIPETNLNFQFHYFAFLPTDALPTDPSRITGGIFELLDGSRVNFPATFAYSNAIAVTVPEPASLVLFGLGMCGAWRRQRRHS